MAGFNLFKFLAGDDEESAPKKGPAPSTQPSAWERFLRGSAAGTPMPKFSLGFGGTPSPKPGNKVEPVEAPAAKEPPKFSGDYSSLKTNVPLDVLRDPNASKHVNGTYGATNWGDLKEIPQYVPGQTNKKDTSVFQNSNPAPSYRSNEEVLSTDARDSWTAGLGTNSLTNVRELTWDEYDALSPRARAAIDANTALLAAVRADTQAALKTADQSDDSYASGIEALFGKEGGSDTYAPATLKALQDLGLSNTETGDIDQYLNGGALLRSDDLESFNPTPIPVENGMNVAGDTSPRIQNALALGDKALASMASKLQSGENPLSGLTYDDPVVSELDQLFDSLALRDNQRIFQQDPAKAGEVIGLFLQENPSIDQDTFARYFEDRINRYDYSRAAGDQAASLGNGAPELYIDPSELRSLIYQKGGQ